MGAWAIYTRNSGYTEDGLFAFRQGKPTSIICMNGYDLHLLLEHGLNLAEVLDPKKRCAVETGRAFVEVRELYSLL